MVESLNNLRIKSEQSLNIYSIIQIKLKRILSLIFQYLSGLKSTEYRKYLRYTEQKIGLMSSKELNRIMEYYFNINKNNKYFIQKKITKNIYLFKITK